MLWLLCEVVEAPRVEEVDGGDYPAFRELLYFTLHVMYLVILSFNNNQQ